MSSFLDDETSEDALSSEEEQSDTDDEKEKYDVIALHLFCFTIFVMLQKVSC